MYSPIALSYLTFDHAQTGPEDGHQGELRRLNGRGGVVEADGGLAAGAVDGGQDLCEGLDADNGRDLGDQPLDLAGLRLLGPQKTQLGPQARVARDVDVGRERWGRHDVFLCCFFSISP